jgi:formate hydrogenlyase transcriptional activator
MRKTIHWISSSALKALERYDWPGNIRELQNVIERAVVLSTGSVLQVPLDSLIEALKRAGWVVGGTRGGAQP